MKNKVSSMMIALASSPTISGVKSLYLGDKGGSPVVNDMWFNPLNVLTGYFNLKSLGSVDNFLKS